ncbi:MAG: PAS-domain containing protein [Desulfuromonadales bacterium]
MLYNDYAGKLFELFLLLLVAMILAQIMSRRIVRRLEILNKLTHDLPVTLTTDSGNIVWPESGVEETAQLTSNFKLMAHSLLEQFQKVKQSKESLKQRVEERTAELTTAISLLSATLESTADGIVVVDRDGHVSEWNQQFIDLWQVPGEILDMRDADQLLNHVSALLEQPDIFLAEVAMLYKHQEETRDGMISLLDGRILEWHTRPYKIDEDIMGRVWCFRDITARKRNEEELQKMEKLESVGTLAGGIAHDFNNALTGLYGNLALAKMKLANDHPGFRFLEAAEQSMLRTTLLTNRLLTFAQGGDPVTKSLSLVSLIEEVVNLSLSGSNVKPLITSPVNPWSASIDHGQIEQVFASLTTNAREAMPDGGHLTITMENAELADKAEHGLPRGEISADYHDR